MSKIITKYRVEEFYNNCDTYLLHGIYNNCASAMKKAIRLIGTKDKLTGKEIKKENIRIIKTTTLIKLEEVNF